MTKKTPAKADDPSKRDDSVIGMVVPCFILGYYDASGHLIATIANDQELACRALRQSQEYALYKMQSKLNSQP